MTNTVSDKRLKQATALVGDLFAVDAWYEQQHQLVLSLRFRFEPVKSKRLLEDRLKLAGYTYSLSDIDQHLLLTLDPNPKLRIPRLNIILFVATLFSVYVLPVFLFNLGRAQSFSDAVSSAMDDLARGAGIEFTLALMSILLVHEMGHFVASRRRGIITSWPYFIPAPNIIGTFGAVIRSKSPFWNRRDLIEVGAAGPIAGWIVALFWLIYGLSQSAIATPYNVTSTTIPMVLEGESLLVKFLTPILAGPSVPGTFYAFTEAAFAGWVGMLVTAINMLPIGQLDGGHVLYGLGREKQHILGWIAMVVLIGLGFQSMMWWVFAALGLIFRVPHPPTLDDRKELPMPARVMGWASIVIFVISFTPIPFRN